MKNSKLEIQVKSIVKQIIERYKPEEIYLFGSMSSGKYDRDSDVDLLIIKEEVPKLGIERRWQLRKIVEKKDIPVDFLVIKRTEFEERLSLRDPFIMTILSEGKRLYLRPS